MRGQLANLRVQLGQLTLVGGAQLTDRVPALEHVRQPRSAASFHSRRTLGATSSSAAS